MLADLVDLGRHPIDDPSYRHTCRGELDRTGALVLTRFFPDEIVRDVVSEFSDREDEAFYARSTHTVWLTDIDPSLDAGHVANRQIVSTKGLLADDQIPDTSALKMIYGDAVFRSFIAEVVGLAAVHPYADPLSSVNMHFHRHGEELGWHFDNSAFAVTALFRAPDAGGVFEFLAGLRDSAAGREDHGGVAAVLDGERTPERLDLAAGDLVVFRGRDALHRVTPSVGPTTRLLTVFAFNERPGVALSPSAMRTFYGRVAR